MPIREPQRPLLGPPWRQHKGVFRIAKPDGAWKPVGGCVLGAIGVHCVQDEDVEFPTAILTHIGTGLKIGEVEDDWDMACRIAALINSECDLETSCRETAQKAMRQWACLPEDDQGGVQPLIDQLCNAFRVLVP